MEEKDFFVFIVKKVLVKFDRNLKEVKIFIEFIKIGKNVFSIFYNLEKVEFYDVIIIID